MFSQRNEAGKFFTNLLSPQQMRLIRPSWRRHFGTGENKRPAKLIKDLKISDLRGIAVLALPYKWRILGFFNFLKIFPLIF